MNEHAGPLDGVLVADFSRVVAAPLATMFLGDLGADVIKVERPETGDDTRSWGPPWAGDDATYYLAVNRNKRSVTLDLNDPVDLADARILAARCDVLMHNFRPGVMEGFGLGYTDVVAANPKVVYCAVSGFAPRGPTAKLPGLDLLAQAMSGLMHVTGAGDGPPQKVGVPIVDILAGCHAAIGVLAALVERSQTGRGRLVDISLFDSALAGLANQVSGVIHGAPGPIRDGNRHPSIAPYEAFEAADGPFIVAAANDRLWRRTCAALGRLDLLDDERFAYNSGRRLHADEIRSILEATFATAPADHWIAELRSAGVPAGPIHDIPDALAWADAQGLEPVVTEPLSGFRSLRAPLRLDGRHLDVTRPPPTLGQHTDEVRRWLRRS